MTVQATAQEPGDVAVLGGGIAGAAACVALARLGHAPLWIAPAKPAADRIGETLAPAARTILADLGLATLLDSPHHRPANAVYSAWGSDRLTERSGMLHLEGPGLVLDRPAFEAQMRAAALEAGAQPIDSAVNTVERAAGSWALTLADGQRRTARFLIDCTGRAGMLARRLAAHRLAAHRRADRLVCAHAFLRQRDNEVEPTPATLIEAVADGWWYATLLPDRRLALAYFSDPDLLPRGLSRDADSWRRLAATTLYIRQWLDSAGYSPDTPPALASAGTTWLEPAAEGAAGTGWAAAGDAAAAFDPLSSHGITTALWSARAAARAAGSALRGDIEPLAAYADAVARGVADFRRQHLMLHARETRFADRPFWQRRNGGGYAAAQQAASVANHS
ncbi:glycine oxidase maturase GoxB [Oceanibaculum pacificum]|uniref:FAD-binding domain-containing protein n=1 Tax=Oceanibaculum pacificum TaxID=580166 RepID=A0A154W540_9PROT|nr:glycine oxidase maturase GoxB [Oceanibaculum pacificum]KZD08567.1 hypothetical protein AUP43_08540 [Oceanibaculum pacificum]